MKKFYLIILATLIIGLTSMIPIERKDKKSTRQKNVETVQTTFHQGMITFKINEGVGKFNRQSGDVIFNLPSLDQLTNQFEVNLLEQRFKFNPQKLKSGMPDLSRIYRIEFPEKFSVNEIVNAFNNNPLVEYAEPIPVYTLCELPDDELLDQCQHLPQIMAPEAWDIHKGEEGPEEVVIAIVDTGIDWDHEDLQSNVWQNMLEDADGDGQTMEYIGGQWVLDPDDINGVDDDYNGYIDDLIGWDFPSNGNDPNPYPSNPFASHGTHCAGISCGVTNNGTGIASISWNLSVMGICATNDGNVTYGYDGIIYAAENGADIISNSWGGPGVSQANEDAINYAQQQGSIILAAAGNSNSLLTEDYPSAYTGVISAASVNVDDTKAEYSSFGPYVDISAPGGGSEGGILSSIPNNEYDLSSGTSMACPLVAGCFGLLKSYHPDWTNDQLITQVLGTADNINTLNPDYQYMLGTGRVNAFHMLIDENVTMPQEFKLMISDATQVDENENDINEQGEEVVMNFEIHNFVPYIGEDDVTILLQCTDPEIEILDGTAIVNIPPEGSFAIEDQFLIKVGENAHSHFVDFSLHFQSNTPVVYGQDINYQLLIAPSGIFVFEGEHNVRDYSGMFIKSFLDRLDYEVTYSNTYPATLRGFETVFISYGNQGETFDFGTLFTEEHSLLFQDYLEDGGNIYVEVSNLFNRAVYFGFQNYSQIKQLFGVSSHPGNNSQNPIDSLIGIEGSLFEGITFTESNQLNNWRIEKPYPITGAIIPFQEYGYGNVSILNDGATTYGHKTFYFTYALAELIDNSAMNSRYNMLLKLMEFFDYELPEGYVLSNFTSDKTFGAIPLEVQFSDISLSDSSYQLNSWKWDFNSDGIIDSEEQNPTWTYTDNSSYDVTLIVSNGMNSDTLILEEYINIIHGYLVFEGIMGGPCYSGTFISDFFSEHGHSTTLTTSFPSSLMGYDAVFLSFGNYGLNYTEFTSEMAAILSQYIEGGGYVYLEGGDALGFDQASNNSLHTLFGLWSIADGVSNEIDSLAGKPYALTTDMVFTSSNQSATQFIDIFTPLGGVADAFIESNYGTVAVQYDGNYDQRTFCFSYTLAELVDSEFPNTREELLKRICSFFDIIITDVKEPQADQTVDFKVYPNPVGSQITICYSLNQESTVSIDIYSINGQHVVTLENKKLPKGKYRENIVLKDLPAGVYFCTLKTNEGMITKKIIKL